MRRNQNIAKNKEKLAALGLVQNKSASENAKEKLKQANEDAGESDYLPSNDPARESENEENDNVTSKKNDAPISTAKEKLQALKSDPGSMVAYNQLREFDKVPIGIDDNEAEELLKISDADVYLETCKRDVKRKYKIPDEMVDEVNEKIVKVQKVLHTEGAEAANKLVHEHEYAKIRAKIEKGMDDKLELKFRDMIKKLAEPGLKNNLDESDNSTKAAAESDKSPEASESFEYDH
ncbi:hypothetical protein AgCh_035851 [Apium graveolens]